MPSARPASSWNWLASTEPEVRQLAARWLASPALRRLTAAFDGPAPPGCEHPGPAALAAWSAAVLDTRRGAERRDARPVTWPPARLRALLAAAGPLGLLATAPPRRTSYRAVVVLGGAATGNRLRTALARRIAERADVGLLVALTAERALSEREIAAEPDSREDRTEWANLLRNVDAAVGPLRPVAETAWRDREYRTADGRRLRLLIAPSGSAHRRATTADGLRFLLARVPAAQRRELLLVTSAIYAPYQFLAGAPVALSDGDGIVELIGTPTATDGEQALLAQRVGQEIHAAVQAAALLCT